MNLIDVSDDKLIHYWLLTGLYLLPLTWMLIRLLPPRLKHAYIRSFLFFYTLSVSIYIFGVLVVITIVLLLRYDQFTRKKTDNISLAVIPEYQRSPVSLFSIHGEGFGFRAITKNELPKSMRQKMMMALNRTSSPEVNKINAAVLTDDIDEMRLYAQSILEKQERAIIQQIKRFTHKVDNCHTVNEIAFYQKQLAHALWQQVYSSLVNQESATILIDRIIHYSKGALIILEDDIELPLLIAKCYLRKNQYEEAQNWLSVAQKNGSPDYKIISYLAEIDFHQKDYQKVAALFRGATIKGSIRLEPVRKFWTSND